MSESPAHDVFLSYSRSDAPLAAALAQALASQGVDVWTDAQILPGDAWDEGIAGALRESRNFVFLISPGWESSAYNMFELGAALSAARAGSGRRLIPVLRAGTDPASLPYGLRRLKGLTLDEDSVAQVAEQIAATLKFPRGAAERSA